MLKYEERRKDGGVMGKRFEEGRWMDGAGRKEKREDGRAKESLEEGQREG